MVDFEKSRLKALQKIQSVALFDAITEQSAINNSPARRMKRAKYWQKLDEIEKYEAMQETTTAGAIAKEQKLDQLCRELAAIEAMGDTPAPAVAQHNKAQPPIQKTHYVLLNERLVPRTTWRGGRIRATDILTLEEAARFASTHASTDITPNDFLRAAANGEILLRAIVQGAAKVQSFDGAIFCNAGQVDENIVPAGSIPTLPLTACQHLAAAGRASWRTFDGFESIEGVLMRFTNGALIDGEPNFETVPADCRVMGNDVYALADAFIEVPAHSTATPVPVVAVAPLEAGPESLTTNEIANCFAELRGWDVKRWKSELGSPDGWLKDCQHCKGTRGRGGYESTWWPVKIAVALVKLDPKSARSLRARFKKNEPLKQWLDTLEINIPDNSDNQ